MSQFIESLESRVVLSVVAPTSTVVFINPQPLPPRQTPIVAQNVVSKPDPGGPVYLNPQPLPP
jgi:hypothetical protein